ncbi:MAG: PEP-CTERM sorting domain-containing protein [Verrucomicrobiota bacterium JB022]|nr:PEP-CTERM sorting domain-containing protein [Verrucomicrobiota bacterium JB022]
MSLQTRIAVVAAVSLAAVAASTAYGAINLSPEILTTGGTLEFTNDLTFTISTDGTVDYIAFDEWSASYTTQRLAYSSGSISYQINDGPVLSAGAYYLYDSVYSDWNDLSAYDGILAIDSIFVSVGDTLTFFATSIEFDPEPEFNPAGIGEFTGDVFLASMFASRMSGNISANGAPEPTPVVPEPSTYAALAGLATLGFAFWRRRKA